ncbi:protein SHORTAGE IN CHIASMATA 1 [Magnolia sinica]|uniref:protein SHORTAGE IN CHIASMATA 1 n=1 Tax=Magnolia sinica TaxID=86752 RepID=UPI002658405D|nr:protein SHORTAGE IN CHIASMATA 1 [Magnolia sinica]XP_058075915.1 protein SHORTAGE IN CHIASMATA 1 [Magnolia sinica]XP_058075916.1 protein SHORTAGE IN CHIASMATA 1 [Magnolia sinica]
MRTRFLNVDFFRLSPNQTLENISIFRLPIPHLPAAIFPSETEISSFDLISCNSSEVDRLPFENALSQFLYAVLPSNCDEFHVIRSLNEVKQRNFESGASLIEIPEKDDVCSIIEENEEKCRNFRSESPELEIIEGNANSFVEKNGRKQRNFRSESPEIEIVEKENELSDGEKNERRLKEITFEIPEVDFPPEQSVCSCDGEDGRVHFEIPDFKIPVDILKVKLGETIPYPYEISRSVYSVEDIPTEHHKDQSFYVAESCFLQNRIIPYTKTVLNFEINEIGLEISTFPSMEDEFCSLLSRISQRNWSEMDDLMVNSQELLVSPDVEILESLSGHGPYVQSLEPQTMCLHSLIDTDFMIPRGNVHLGRHSIICPKTSVDDIFSMASVIQFHEVEILDLECFQSFQEFASSQVASEPETSGQMFREDMNSAGSFYESIVNTELALVDDAFKTLPIPVLCDDKEIMSLPDIFEDILDKLKMHPSSASDGIYLDWHLLQDDTCDSNMCSTYRNLLEEVDTCDVPSALKSTNERVVIELVFYDDSPDELNTVQCREILTELPSAISDSVVIEPLSKTTTSHPLKDENQKTEGGQPAVTINPEKVSLLLESMSQFNDLNFFLKARKVAAGRNSEDVIHNKTDSKASLHGVCSSDPIMICSPPEVNFQPWDIEIHEVKLSDHMLGLIDNMQKRYFIILENDTDLNKKHFQFQAVDNFKLLSLPKQKLMDLITNTNAPRTTSASEDETLMAYAALYAIKQMAYYLCFYGIHSSHQYARNLSQSLEYMKAKLSPLLSLIEDAYMTAEKGIIESHPSLSVVEGILRLNNSRNGRKILLVSERVFWWPLNRKLNAMSISFHEVRNVHSYSNQLGALDSDEFMKSILDSLPQTDCILISHEHVFPSFPFNKFSIILEYGGSCASSRISTISSKLVGLPHIHFLKMKLEESGVPKALCEGFDASQHLAFAMEGASVPDQHKSCNNQQFVGLLNFIPVVEKGSDMASLEVADTLEASQVPNSMSRLPFTIKSGDMHSSMSSFPDIVIIVNTQSSDKEMLISRRSSYQKILAMEKGGVQVVEREFNLPVDLIFNAAICLVWYDARNFGINTTSAEKASSCIPECMENIATNVLMSLSFAFSCCVLVFEGDRSFLTAIMEASDGLYAAAASLDMHLQLFCSYSSELTDEIILNCTKYATKLNRGLYPAMLESETLAESFLTRFPSINPLTAHAILSSGGTLVEFLEWSQEKRIQAIGKYHVPDESIALFSALCKYGELGESKSGMTECSSAVSSAIESDYNSSKMQSQRKRQKYTINTQSVDIPTDEYLQFEPLNRSEDGSPKPYRESWPLQGRIFSNCGEVFEKSEAHNVSLKDQPLDQKPGADTFFMEDLDWNDIKIFDTVDEDVRGTIINKDNLPLDNDLSPIADTRSFSRGATQVSKEAVVGNSMATRRSSFNTGNLATFPTSSEIDCDSDIWFSLKDHNQRLDDNISGKLDIKSYGEAPPMKRRGEFLEESKMQKSTRNALGLSSRQKVTPPYGETPLPNAIHSSRLQQGSPWTVEFLNRIKEKKERNKQSSLPCNTCIDCPRSSKKIDKFFKRRSPSTIDNYRYQGGSQNKKTIQQKWQKQSRKPLHSVANEKKALSFDPTWTPIDKRARQNLSFSRDGKDKQSKLVWSDRNVHSLRKRYQDEP